MAFVSALLVSLCLPSPAQTVAQEPSALALVGARIVTMAGPEIESGILVLHDGVIARVGPLDSTPIPAGALVRDVRGRVLMPGLVDTHSHIGAVEGADSSGPIQPEVRVLDSINVLDP